MTAENDRPVWITGIGMVTPLGMGWRANWEAMCEGRSGIRRIASFDAEGLASRIAGEITADVDQEFRQQCRLPFPSRYARFTQLAMLAGRMAIDDAGLDTQSGDPGRFGVSVGVGGGGFHALQVLNVALASNKENIEQALDHNYVAKYMPNAAAAQLSIWLQAQGPVGCVSVACASGAQSIAQAMDWIRSGRADVVLAGGTDTSVDRFAMAGYAKAGALCVSSNDAPERASRPFDRDRDGFVMSEGACVMVLESEAHALARGARRRAVLAGYGATGEAYNIVAQRPEGEGIARCIRAALDDAGIDGGQVDYVSAHGTGTRLNDPAETRGIRLAFGEAADRIPVSSQKSMIGHSIGASSAIEAAVTALSLEHGVITPTINLEHPDPECDLDYVPGQAREAKLRYAVSNAFAFGGHNCCLVLGV